MEWMNQILDRGGCLSIKKYAKDDIKLSMSIKIDGDKYHKAILFSSIQEMNNLGNNIVKAFLKALERLTGA